MSLISNQYVEYVPDVKSYPVSECYCQPQYIINVCLHILFILIKYYIFLLVIMDSN